MHEESTNEVENEKVDNLSPAVSEDRVTIELPRETAALVANLLANQDIKVGNPDFLILAQHLVTAHQVIKTAAKS